MAACAVIVAEAGGRFTSLDGRPGPPGPGAVATNGRLHDEVLQLLTPDEGGTDGGDGSDAGSTGADDEA
jgi:histidinol-phosphatase